jgi:hypothetical protein
VGWSDTREAVAALLAESEALVGDEDDPDGLERRIGAVLFAAVAVARLSGVDPEGALRRYSGGEAERYDREIAEADATREGLEG